jgi:hypothetical protein
MHAEKKLDSVASPHGEHKGFFDGSWPGVRPLIPVYAHDPYERSQQPRVEQISWWPICTAWVRYHSIQMRWDIERGLARLFRRRWINRRPSRPY